MLERIMGNALQDIIDTADCNAETNFTKSDGSQGILGWALGTGVWA